MNSSIANKNNKEASNFLGASFFYASGAIPEIALPLNKDGGF